MVILSHKEESEAFGRKRIAAENTARHMRASINISTTSKKKGTGAGYVNLSVDAEAKAKVVSECCDHGLPIVGKSCMRK